MAKNLQIIFPLYNLESILCEERVLLLKQVQWNVNKFLAFIVDELGKTTK